MKFRIDSLDKLIVNLSDTSPIGLITGTPRMLQRSRFIPTEIVGLESSKLTKRSFKLSKARKSKKKSAKTKKKNIKKTNSKRKVKSHK
jgi:hypothetical protein